MVFTGTWRVVSSPDLPDDYLGMEAQPYVKLRQTGDGITGEYRIGLQAGGIDGRARETHIMDFSFAGMDELEEVNGWGTASVTGEHLSFTLRYHMGDEFSYECERLSPQR